MKRVVVYVDASVIGGCLDAEFSADSLALWREFADGRLVLAVSAHTLRELQGAPDAVREQLAAIPDANRILVGDLSEAFDLAEAYLGRGVVGPGSRADAIHVALATASRCDVLVSWNFRHIVNLNRIRLFQSVNIECGYGPIEIRTPREVLHYDEDV